jgi:hypothetical protein
MIVCRWLYSAKVGKESEVAALVATEVERVAPSGVPWRLFVSTYGQFGTVALEAEYESLAAFEEFNRNYVATPGASAFGQKLGSLSRSPLKMEFWRRTR